ncbi:fungal-specific transcription factor domain-containing protein [Aspergillus cavernicola]|uniref:Fungal-specific transcription factor domain-containing protein n=1 Tax=Aspergillus cavernicola TaxID=176166 RepID=A0ABR4IRT0_9EURO
MPPEIARNEASFATHRFRLQRASPHESPRLHGSGSGSSKTASRPACDRCRKLKKRCTRGLPDCASCVHAGRRCSYQILQARVEVLTQFVSELGQQDTHAIETPGWNVESSTPISTAAPRLEIPDPTVLVDAFFHHVYRAYPFIDEERIREAPISSVPDSRDTNSIMLYMIMAIGYTSLERSGKAPPGITPGFDIPYADIMQRCIMQESIDSIQILVLLALYSLFDPDGPCTWSIVGIITRQAMAQGLTRPVALEENLSPKTMELRRRLFWSIFGLDRMMAVSVGATPGLVVDEMDIPFPAITVEEFASPKRTDYASMLQVSRHVIELRQLEHKILSTIHLQSRIAVSALAQADRSSITTRLRSEVENWYSHGCLITRPELDNVRLHDTMGWLNARYYHLLLLLYYPCQFNAGITAQGTARVSALLELVRKFIQYNRVLLSHQQLPLNRVTLSRLVPPCLVLIYCFARGSASTPFNGRTEIRAFIDILKTFPEPWVHAQRLTRIMVELDDLVASNEGYSIETHRQEWLLSLRREMVSLLGETLGKASCYQDLVWEEQEILSYARGADESPNMTAPPFFAGELDSRSIVCSFL